jgi:hypothetical protein
MLTIALLLVRGVTFASFLAVEVQNQVHGDMLQ